VKVLLSFVWLRTGKVECLGVMLCLGKVECCGVM